MGGEKYRPAVKCAAKTSKGVPCARFAVHGATVCPMHGGRSPQVRKHAVIRAEVARWGLTDEHVDPGETMLRLVAQSARRAQEYAHKLGQAYEQAETAEPDFTDVLSGGLSALIGLKRASSGEGTFRTGEEVIRGLVQLEAEERDRCARFSKMALDAGIAERQVRLAERQGALLAAAVQAVLADRALGLTAEQRRLVPQLLRRQLEAAAT